VAGTAVVAELVLTGLPQWRSAAAALALVAVLLWLWYLALVARGLWAIIVGRARGGVNGAILLSTVSTQSIVLLGPLLGPRQVPRAAWAVLIILGYLLYLTGLVLIVRHYLRERGLRLADGWDNTNCIGHGALAISGLAAVVRGLSLSRGSFSPGYGWPACLSSSRASRSRAWLCGSMPMAGGKAC
jgi:hypothetical protein